MNYQMLSTQDLPRLLLIFIRVLSILMTAPIFSHRSIPTVAKIGLAGLLAALLLPIQTSDKDEISTSLTPFLLVIAQEILVGVLIGFASNLIFMAVDIAAKMMGLQIGFQAANLFDPMSNIPTSALEQFYILLAMTLFLTINGHHWLLTALTHTFVTIPLGTFVLTSLTLERLIALTNDTFITGVRIALPVVGTLLMADIGLGLIARAVPQVQVFFVGLPVKLGLGFLVLAFTLSLTLPLIKDLLSQVVSNILAISG